MSQRVLFNSKDMTDDEFYDVFRKACHIDEMDIGSGYWEYTSPDNVRVRVGFKKEVVLFKILDRNTVIRSFD